MYAAKGARRGRIGSGGGMVACEEGVLLSSSSLPGQRGACLSPQNDLHI